MKEFSYTITDKDGIHARPAGMLVKEAGKFSSKISISKGEKTGDLKKIFSVMSLAAKKDDVVKVTADGPDEDTAIEQLENFFKTNL